MAQIPPTIPVLGSPNLVSYDYTDFLAKLGYANFYLMRLKDENYSDKYLLSNEIRTTNSRYENLRLNTEGGETDSFNDYETTVFTTPQTIRGTVYMQVGFGQDRNNANISDAHVYLIKKDKNDVETTIIDFDLGNNLQSQGIDDANLYRFAADAPETKMPIGSKLVFRMTLTMTDTGSSQWVEANMGTDPEGNATTGTEGIVFAEGETLSKLSIPFKIIT